MAQKKRSHQDALSDARRIIKEVNAKQFKPLYIFHGEEPYYIDLLTDHLEDNVLEESERDFNLTVLYGSDTKAEDVASMARQYPVMAPYQVIIVKETQAWRSYDDLLPLVNHPVPTSVVVINLKGKTIDKRTSFYKAASKVAEIFQSDKLPDWEVEKWMHNYCKSKGIQIEDRAVAQLCDHIGNHLGNLINAIDKLEVVCKGDGPITEHAVMENIGISKDFNVFELNKAIGQRNFHKALLIANYFANNQKEHHIIPTLSSVYSYFRKLAMYHEYPNKADNYGLARALGTGPSFVTEYKNAASRYPAHALLAAFEVLHDIDLKSKGVGNASASSGELVTELVGRLMRV